MNDSGGVRERRPPLALCRRQGRSQEASRWLARQPRTTSQVMRSLQVQIDTVALGAATPRAKGGRRRADAVWPPRRAGRNRRRLRTCRWQRCDPPYPPHRRRVHSLTNSFCGIAWPPGAHAQSSTDISGIGALTEATPAPAPPPVRLDRGSRPATNSNSTRTPGTGFGLNRPKTGLTDTPLRPAGCDCHAKRSASTRVGGGRTSVPPDRAPTKSTAECVERSSAARRPESATATGCRHQPRGRRQCGVL